LEAPLKQRISSRTDVRVGVIGMGYVGLPLAIRLAEKDFSVIGIDISAEVIAKLKANNSTVEGIPSERLRQARLKNLKLLRADNDGGLKTSKRVVKQLMGVDVFLICVPTPLHKSKEWEPDTRYIQLARDLLINLSQLEKASRKLPKERLIVLESTTYPGTTQEIFSELIKQYEPKAGQWYLAYSPERMNPGPHAYDDKTDDPALRKPGEEFIPGAFQIPRIVGAKDRASKTVVKLFYETIFYTVRPVRDIETAEMIKLVENTFRFTAIAFANEVTRLAKALGLNGWEVLDAARGKGFGFGLCSPGLIGGHCLPIDPHYLSSAVRGRRVAATFVDVAESEHQNMRREAFDLIQRLLNQRNKGIAKSSILFLGVAYKKDVGDIRESAAIELMERLYAAGAKLSFWDPVRAVHPAKPLIRLIFTREEHRALPKRLANKLRVHPEQPKFYTEPKEEHGDWKKLKKKVISSTPKYDCIVLATDHEVFRTAYGDLMTLKDAPPIADLSNAISRWLGEQRLSVNQRPRIRRIMKERKKYMLIGRH